MKLVSSHYAGTANIGDAACSPFLYFDFGHPVEVVKFGRPIPPCDAVIFGGGALGNRVGSIASQARLKIVWGAGETRHGETAAHPAPSGFDLFGSRDWGQLGAEWVPCASCLSPLFDQPCEIERDAVLYRNFRRPRPAVDGLPEVHNEVTLAAAIAFLGSAETVVTNSYHGAYWATLLGRRVVVVDAYSSKLHGFRHPPAHADAGSWASARPVTYPGALAECREVTLAFHRRVMDRLAA